MALMLTTVACGSSDSGSDEGKGEQVTIVYARGKDDTGSTEKLIEAFEKKHPNIKVKFKEMPTDTGVSHDQYVTMLSAQSSEIDVFDLDVIWPAEFAQAGYVQDLDRFIQRDNIDMSKYIPGAEEGELQRKAVGDAPIYRRGTFVLPEGYCEGAPQNLG